MPKDDSGGGGCLLAIVGLVLLEDHPIIGIILILMAIGHFAITGGKMSRTKRQMQRLLDRYTDLQIDFDDWLRKNINHSRDVRVDERDGVKVAKTGVVEIRFKRPFLISRHFVVNKLVFDDSDEREFCVEGGVVFGIVENIPLSCLTLKEKNALVRELDARGYFDDEK